MICGIKYIYHIDDIVQCLIDEVFMIMETEGVQNE